MNILIDGLPTAVYVGGQIYDINADYQTGLRIITAFEDPDLTKNEKCMVLVCLLYKERPEPYAEAVLQGLKFLDCGDKRESDNSSGSGGRRYSFAQDARYIYAGVDRVLQGRLNRGEFVHWWEFATAFMELPEDCMMSRILYLRIQKAKGKLTKEERQQWEEMHDILELPEELSPEDQRTKDAFLSQLKR